MSGTIPLKLANLPHLVEISLGSNNLSGTVPTFQAAKLQLLNISSNKLAGSLSSSFYHGDLGHAALKTLDLMNNQVTGTISEAIGSWSSLETLSLSNNTISGMLLHTSINGVVCRRAGFFVLTYTFTLSSS
jgi:Leucine-rich repeat (LRR) protein